MNKLLTIGEAANVLGVTTTTMRNWDKKGILKPDEVTIGGDRRYKIESLKKIKSGLNFSKDDLRTIAYARVSSIEQKEELIKQVEILTEYCSQRGFDYEIIQDLGSGVNSYKKGVINLVNLIIDSKVRRLVLTRKDRLLRFGSELIFSVCEAKNVEVIIINKGDNNIHIEEELTKDVIEMITTISTKLYGKINDENKKLLNVITNYAKNKNNQK